MFERFKESMRNSRIRRLEATLSANEIIIKNMLDHIKNDYHPILTITGKDSLKVKELNDMYVDRTTNNQSVSSIYSILWETIHKLGDAKLMKQSDCTIRHGIGFVEIWDIPTHKKEEEKERQIRKWMAYRDQLKDKLFELKGGNENADRK
jgi:hypothetical protein